MSAIDRRSFLTESLALLGLANPLSRAAARKSMTFERSPFTLGVASGDPSADGMVLWTRLALDPLNGGDMPPVPISVSWEIASDDRMKHIVQQGSSTAWPAWAHSVHVEVRGLEPSRWYWYRFGAGDARSTIGRTRTLPRTGTPVDALRFAFLSCQNYEAGFFTALRHASGEDLDLIFHLGDYIYENAPIDGRARRHTGPELTTLAHYRNRYAQYQMDADLQAAHAVFPWIVTWDDHEVANNYAGGVSERMDPVDVFLRRRAHAYQAYYEHMPIRRASMPRGASLRLYRRFSFGSLASFFILDTRQYRSDQPCGDRVQSPCTGTFDSNATLLGRAQERWLIDGLDRSSSGWNILPQQVMMAKVDLDPGPDERYSMDQWPGYEASRVRLLDFLGTRRPNNPVVLTGDIHNNWVNDLTAEAANPKAPVVATELVGTSVTSGGDGTDMPESTRAILAANPFVRFHNNQRGYVRCELTAARLRADYRVLDYVSKPGAPVNTRASFVVESGRPGAVRL